MYVKCLTTTMLFYKDDKKKTKKKSKYDQTAVIMKTGGYED